MIDRRKLFDGVRASPFGGKFTPSQVGGVEAIVKAWEDSRLTDLRWLAYMLATAFHETARTMQPITEFGKKAYFDKYEPGTKIGRAIGNTVPGDGYRFRGRGYVQITGRRNYVVMSGVVGADLVSNPDIALRPDLAAAIMIEGMVDGKFTAKKLSGYLSGSKTDWRNARRVINGTDKAELIAGYAQSFFAELADVGLPADPPPRPVEPPLPPPDIPKDEVEPEEKEGWLIRVLRYLFG